MVLRPEVVWTRVERGEESGRRRNREGAWRGVGRTRTTITASAQVTVMGEAVTPEASSRTQLQRPDISLVSTPEGLRARCVHQGAELYRQVCVILVAPATNCRTSRIWCFKPAKRSWRQALYDD